MTACIRPATIKWTFLSKKRISIMNRLCFLGYLLAGLVMSLAVMLPAQAGQKSESKVKASATATKAGDDGKQTVTITLEIVKGWHIYANPVGAEDFEGNKTSVTI